MDSRSSLNFIALKCLDIKKFLLMSRGFEELGLDRKVSDSKDFANFVQAVTGDGNTMVDEPSS